MSFCSNNRPRRRIFPAPTSCLNCTEVKVINVIRNCSILSPLFFFLPSRLSQQKKTGHLEEEVRRSGCWDPRRLKREETPWGERVSQMASVAWQGSHHCPVVGQILVTSKPSTSTPTPSQTTSPPSSCRRRVPERGRPHHHAKRAPVAPPYHRRPSRPTRTRARASHTGPLHDVPHRRASKASQRRRWNISSSSTPSFTSTLGLDRAGSPVFFPDLA